VPLFQPDTTYPAIPAADGIAVVTGDFNGDGRQDAAMSTTGHVLVYLQNADGSLAAPVSYEASTYAISLATGDLNHDGRTDIVAGDFISNTISIYLQKADGSLASRVSYPSGIQPDAVAVGDLNDDGLDDVAVSHWNTASVGVFPQNSAGTLNAMQSYPAPLAGYDDIAIGDVNGDGLNDIVKMNGLNSVPRLSVYLQVYEGTLAGPVPFDINCTGDCSPGGLGIGDVTGDGRADVVVSYGGIAPTSNIAVFAQGSDGRLQAPAAYLAHDVPEPLKLADIDLDGRTDLVVAHGYWGDGFSFYPQPLSSGYSFFALPHLGSYYEPEALSVADLNNDGLPDVVVAGAGGLSVSYRNNVPPIIIAPTAVPMASPTP